VGGIAVFHRKMDGNCIIEQSCQKQLKFTQNMALVIMCVITVTLDWLRTGEVNLDWNETFLGGPKRFAIISSGRFQVE